MHQGLILKLKIYNFTLRINFTSTVCGVVIVRFLIVICGGVHP